MLEQQKVRLPYSHFKQLVREGAVRNVILEPHKIKGEIVEGELSGRLFVTVRVEDPELVKLLDEQGISYTGRLENKWLEAILSWLLPMLCSSPSGVSSCAGWGRAPRACFPSARPG